MSISELAFTPSPAIKLNGNALAGGSLNLLRSIEAESTVGATGWCRLEFALVPASGDQTETLPQFHVTDTIEASFVTATDSGTVENQVFKGDIVAIGTEVDLDGQQLVIDAFDAAYKLGPDVKIRTFVNKTDQNILNDIARECGLSLQVGSEALATAAKDHCFQFGTNQEFVEQICRRNGATWKVTEGKLDITQGSAGASVTTLTWGENLTRLSARYSSADHANEVTVRGWDPATKESIVGNDTATKTKFPSTVTATGDHTKVPTRTVTSVRTPVVSQAEAKIVATGIARRMVATAFSGQGEAFGNPDIVAGCKIEVDGLYDTQWAGDYWVTTARHTWSSYRQYTTEFHFGPVEPSSLVDVFGTDRSGNTSANGGFGNGVTIGLVTNNKDPENLGRVKVKYPYLSDDLESDWVRLASHGAGKERGIMFIPEVNDEVVVAFEHGEISRPFVLGSLWNGKDPIPDTTLIANGEVKERVIYSRLGHKIRLSDGTDPDTKFVSIELEDGTTKVHIGESKIEVIANDGKPIELKNDKGSILIDASGNITIKGEKIDLKSASGDITLDGMNVNLKSKAAVSVKAGSTAEVKASAKMDVDGGGMLNLKGGMVKVN